MTSGVLFRVFARSFLMQASWNFERMQNLGFCYAILPVLKRLYRGNELKAAIKRHLEFFNTHPYMTAPILGVVSGMEESLEEGHLQGRDISGIKTGVMGSYGAIGDSFFWGGLRPFASVLGVCLAITGCVFAPVVFLIVFNVPHLLMRVYGFRGGRVYGLEVFDRIGRMGFADLARRLKGLALFFAGLGLALSAGSVGDFFDAGTYVWPALFTLVFFLFFVEIIRKGASPHTAFYILVAFSISAAVFV